MAGLISCGTAAEAVLSSFSTAAAMETLVGGAAESVMTGFSTGATIEGGSAGAVTGTTMAGATAGGLAGSGRSDAGGASSLEFGTSAGTGDAGICTAGLCKLECAGLRWSSDLAARSSIGSGLAGLSGGLVAGMGVMGGKGRSSCDAAGFDTPPSGRASSSESRSDASRAPDS